MWIEVIVVGLGIGVLVGLMGVGGGIVLVPALAYLLGMNQHLAQGTSLFTQLPPLGLGALLLYWKRNQVDKRAGVLCAAGLLAGGYSGSLVAIRISARDLRGAFGLFLIFSAVMLWRKAKSAPEPVSEKTDV